MKRFQVHLLVGMSEELVSPIVNEDRSVTFNFESEHAKKVNIAGWFRLGRKVGGPGAPVASVPMKKISDSVWTYTTEPVLPGIYRYSFIVDGVGTPDPLNPRGRYQGLMSVVRVEGEEPMPWDLIPNIQHGTVVTEKIYSETLRQLKHCAIYLPPSYWSTGKLYPVLYLLHGGGGDYDEWLSNGNADNIMDYLISKGRSMETIVAMPDGQVMTPEERRRLRSLRSGRFSASWKAVRSTISDRHANYFTNELLPFLESRYRAEREARAIAGLSMGGAQTFNLITRHPDMFIAAGMFSSAMWGTADEAKGNLSSVRERIRKFRLLYLSCGNWDSLLEITKTLHSLLDELDIRHTCVEGEGGHNWAFWPRSLIDFMGRFSETL